MCQIKQTEACVDCIDKRFVTVADICKCFGIGKESAKKLFDEVMEQTVKDGFRTVGDNKVLFSRVLKNLGISEKNVLDDYDRLKKSNT